MKDKLILAICLLFLNSYLIAQNIQLTLKDGTKVEGFTKYNGWGETPNELEVTIGDETRTYTPSEVNEFTVNEDKYLSRTIELSYLSKNISLDVSNRRAQKESTSTKLESIQKEAFVRVVVQGYASLYTYNDSKTNYYIEKEGEITELVRIKSPNQPTFNKYVGQLNILFSDCGEMTNNDKVQFTKSNLKRNVLEYNECKSEKNSFVEAKRPLRVSLYFVGGYKLTNYTIDDPLYGDELSSDSGNGSFNYGMAFDFSFGRTDRMQIHSDILIQQYEYDATYRRGTAFDQFTDYFVDLDLSYLEVSALLRYNFGSLSDDTLGVFVNAGINQAIQLSDDSSEFSETNFFSEVRTTERDPLNGDINSIRTSFVLGAGFRYQFVTGEVRYDFNPRISSPTVANTGNINFLLSLKVL